MRYTIKRLFMGCVLAGMVLAVGCTTTVDWRKLDTQAKRYHFAQLSFKDMQTDYIAMFPRQPEETKIYLRENVAPVLHNVKLALDAWGLVVTKGAINIGQESKFTVLFDELALLLKPYIVKEK